MADPSAELTYSFNPYHYANNSPINYIDPDGRYATPIGAFFAWVATGFSAGFTNGFISGIGNTALGGGSFGASLGAGFKSGFNQGLVGGVTGGVFGGIKAASKGLDFFTGTGEFDISKGVGAHGDLSDINRLQAKYVGNFHGVDVYETDNFSKGTGITLPGRGITVSPGAYSLGNDIGLVRHEFGHILEAREIGKAAFYRYVASASLKSAIKQNLVADYYHNTFWTEVWANNLSWEYFRNIPGALQQTLWNEAIFPLRWNSLDDLFRVRRLINYGF